MTAPRVLIAGAGYIGGRTVSPLHQAGFHPVLLSRTIKPRTDAETVRANLYDPDTWASIPSGISKLLFCASASRSDPSSYRSLFVEAQTRLIQFLLKRGDPLDQCIMMSTTGVFGDMGGDWVTEETAPVPSRSSGSDILEGERALVDLFPASTAVRFSGLYGSGRHRLIQAVREQRAFVQPGDCVFLNQIHAEDAAAVLSFLCTHPHPPRILIASDTKPVRRGEVLNWIADQLNCSGAVEDSEQAPSPRHGNKRCCSQALQDLGFRFRYPTYREGYGSLIEAVNT